MPRRRRRPRIRDAQPILPTQGDLLDLFEPSTHSQMPKMSGKRKIESLLHQANDIRKTAKQEVHKSVFEKVDIFKDFIKRDKAKALLFPVSFRMRIVDMVKYGQLWHIFLADADTTSDEVHDYKLLHSIHEMEFRKNTVNLCLWSKTEFDIGSFKLGELANIQYCSHSELWEEESACSRILKETLIAYD